MSDLLKCEDHNYFFKFYFRRSFWSKIIIYVKASNIQSFSFPRCYLWNTSSVCTISCSNKGEKGHVIFLPSPLGFTICIILPTQSHVLFLKLPFSTLKASKELLWYNISKCSQYVIMFSKISYVSQTNITWNYIISTKVIPKRSTEWNK